MSKKYMLIIGCTFMLLIFMMLKDFSSGGWNQWKFSRTWSSELTSLSKVESVSRVDRIAIAKSSEGGMYLSLKAFNRQKPAIITDKKEIIKFFNQLDSQSMSLCPYGGAEEDSYYHVVAFDSSHTAAYLTLRKCKYGKEWIVWNLDGAGVYCVPTPTLLTELFGER